jgi:hypothetical protein
MRLRAILGILGYVVVSLLLSTMVPNPWVKQAAPATGNFGCADLAIRYTPPPTLPFTSIEQTSSGGLPLATYDWSASAPCAESTLYFNRAHLVTNLAVWLGLGVLVVLADRWLKRRGI